ncbi:MAG: hypothetical protein JRG86_10555 [Deltaproteobacteria bacterium]|jgi:uncharacterized membrane protein|nr:hypothetical protein [Deltaproteobacteria bacterium]MBW2498978.1 hypothetical protein [Deltaproteobacteria bacterium]
MVGLGDLPGGAFHSTATAISADASTIVGVGTSARGREAFVWTRSRGLRGLGDLSGGAFESRAEGVTAEGAVVVGSSEASDGPTAFVWRRKEGMRSLHALLEARGVTLPPGWRLTHALGVSARGDVIVGRGRNPSGESEGWVVRLPD